MATIETNRCPRLLQNVINYFLFVVYGLWNKIVGFFSKPTRAALELENNALRAMLESQKQVFREIVRRHEPLLLRIFTSESEQASLRRENERILGSATALEQEIDFVKKVATDQKKQSDSLLNARETEFYAMTEREKLLEAENKDLRNASSEIRTERDGLEKKCMFLEVKKQELETALSALEKKREQETSKWLSLSQRKTLENKAMDFEISLLKTANDQLKIEREDMKDTFEAFKNSISDVEKTSTKYLLEKEAQKEISAQLEREKGKLEVKLVEQGRKLEAEISKCTKKMYGQKRDINDKEEALCKAKRAASSLKAEKDALNEAFDKLTQEKSDLEGALVRLDHGKGLLKSKLNEIQRDIKAWNGIHEEGTAVLQRTIEERSEDLKRFLKMDAQTRDAQRRQDLDSLKQLMEENSSLQKRIGEIESQNIHWENRAREAEQRNAMYQPYWYNSAIVITDAASAPHVPGMGGQ